MPLLGGLSIGLLAAHAKSNSAKSIGSAAFKSLPETIRAAMF